MIVVVVVVVVVGGVVAKDRHALSCRLSHKTMYRYEKRVSVIDFCLCAGNTGVFTLSRSLPPLLHGGDTAQAKIHATQIVCLVRRRWEKNTLEAKFPPPKKKYPSTKKCTKHCKAEFVHLHPSSENIYMFCFLFSAQLLSLERTVAYVWICPKFLLNVTVNFFLLLANELVKNYKINW